MKDVVTVPSYIDTKTPPMRWYRNNGLIALVSIGMIVVASLILEYEVAKLRNPDVPFIPTPVGLDITLTTVVILLGLANITVLIFVFLRHLWFRRWMLATTIIGWVLLAILALVLGDRFLPIVFP